MKLIAQTPKQTLNKAFLKQPVNRDDINSFKANLQTLLGKINENESEEHHKNFVRDFLKDTFYKTDYEINTKGRQDLVIHVGKDSDENVGVILETKKPTNKADMISADNPNKKALHELVLYFLRERIDENNIDIKYLIVTNIYEWFIFDAGVFNRLFYDNKSFSKQYKEWRDKQKITSNTPLFYNEIAKPFIDKINDEVPCTSFDIRDYETALKNEDLEDDKSLIELFKILSPNHLLKIPFADDSNKLDKNFYTELLHIIGLEEVKDKSKLKIDRKAEGKRDSGSLIETAIAIIETKDCLHKVKNLESYGETREERLFGVALELCLTWINRVLFLKLLEAQLVDYHNGNRDYRFLDIRTIQDFDELFTLFHQVLAKMPEDRRSNIKAKYDRVPYLNSSLFEISELESDTVTIESLKDTTELSFINSSILTGGKNKQTGMPTLEYLFEFLDAYDFASENSEGITENNRALINASVLGKVFEKINGYKDGSIYTPGFITMYMCRQAIRLAVVQKFKDYYGWNISEFADIKNYLADYRTAEKIKEFNRLINSLHLCDPAVGSGHFLVSSLNEIIAVKCELGILADANGERFFDVEITIENDELTVFDTARNEFFKYRITDGTPNNKEAQRLQKTLFHEKQTLIENCLFGVDINPNSVKICRLRLWIELLKNAYYKETANYSELETLPNIDINIKAGNSLLSRFALDEDVSKALKKFKYSPKEYREKVALYKNVTNRETKRELLEIIENIKAEFRTEIFSNDKRVVALRKLKGDLFNLQNQPNLFGETDAERKIRLKKEAELEKKIEAKESQIEEIKTNVIYKNAFEWRFEFPEVLDDEGNFIGFDIVIGNPPYGVSIKGNLREKVVELQGKVPDYEIYYFFTNLSRKVLKFKGVKSFIIPNTILFNVFAKDYRENLFSEWQIIEILDCTDFDIFVGSATVRNIITFFIKESADNIKDFIGYRPTAKAKSFEELVSREIVKTDKEVLLNNNQNWALIFKLDSEVLEITSKIKGNKMSLSDFFPEFSQGLIAYDKYQGQDEETIKTRAFHSFEKQKGYKAWLWGEDVTRYSVSWNQQEFINYCESVANPREPKYFKGERILVREITNPSIFAGFTTEEMYNDPAIINIIKPEKEIISIKILLGILNSKLATFYHFNSSPKATKGSFPKILVEDIKNFPIPKIEEKDQKTFVALVDQILELKKTGKDTQALENEIDALVYRLYDLTDDEIAIVEGK